jgi:hypothetical protein
VTGWDETPAPDLPSDDWSDVPDAVAPADAPVVLPEVPDAAALLAAILARPPALPLRFAANAVQRLGCPALQVLLGAMREAAAGGSRAVVVDPSFAFTLAFESFGFGGETEPFTVEYS